MSGARQIDPAGVLEGGAAIVVATADGDCRPALTRGWGPRFDQESRSLTLSVTAPTGSATLGNLESNGRIAVTASQPLTYRTVQLKGVVDHVGAPTAEDRAAAHDHRDRFIADVAQLGITSGADNLFLGDLRTIVVTVAEVFDQTPGRHAGTRLT